MQLLVQIANSHSKTQKARLAFDLWVVFDHLPAMISTDSVDYEVLIRAVKGTAELTGLVCEIGTRAGGSLKIIIDTMCRQIPRPIVSVDPYGWLDYAFGDQKVKFDYTNTMRDWCLRDIHDYLLWLNKTRAEDFMKGAPINAVFFTLEDTEFFKRFSDGVPIYDNGEKKVYEKYSLVFLDGPHSLDAVKAEVDFFAPRMEKGGALVIDDINLVNYEALEKHIFECGFSLVEKSNGRSDGSGRKAAYKK